MKGTSYLQMSVPLRIENVYQLCAKEKAAGKTIQQTKDGLKRRRTAFVCCVACVLFLRVLCIHWKGRAEAFERIRG